jgi:hypothetical protein
MVSLLSRLQLLISVGSSCPLLSHQVSWCTRLSPQMKVPWSLLPETLALCSVLAHLRQSRWSKWEKPESTSCWLFWISAMCARGCLLLVGAPPSQPSSFFVLYTHLHIDFLFHLLKNAFSHSYALQVPCLKYKHTSIPTFSLMSFKFSLIYMWGLTTIC